MEADLVVGDVAVCGQPGVGVALTGVRVATDGGAILAHVRRRLKVARIGETPLCEARVYDIFKWG